jgi:ribose transport system ATP-binding protein
VGSGRTETALCVFGARKADSGTVLVRGKKANYKHPGAAVAESIGLVPEDRKEQGVLGMLNVCSNISLANLQHFVNFGFINSKSEFKNAEDMVEAMKIRTPSILQSVGNLSGGNQQKVVLGKWLTRESKILILDEPTQGIDVGARDEIYQILRKLAEDGKAVLLISSDLGEIMRVCDRVLVMYKGTIVKEFMNCEATHEELLLYCTGGGKRNGAGKS